MCSQKAGGAKIQASSSKPAVELATLVDLLAKSLVPKKDTNNTTDVHPDYKRVFSFNSKSRRLQLCSSAVLRRLFGLKDFKKAFNPDEDGGFIQDFQPSAFGTKSRIGGHLTKSSRDSLSAAVDRLIAAIDQEINVVLPPETSLSVLLLDQPVQHLQGLAKKVGAYFTNQAQTANLVPIAFPDGETKTKAQNKPIAKVISAREQINADNYFELMCSAVKDYGQNQRNWDEDDIDAAIDSLEAERDRVDSQLTRFLNFLDDEALSRVRLTITLQIMEAIAQSSLAQNQPNHQLLAEYVHRVSSLWKSATEVGYSVDLTAAFGSDVEFELLDYLNQATFYFCLPVWPEWETQLFEDKAKNDQGKSYGVVREVSYRFRINGNNPEKNKSAFLARLDKIEELLFSDEETTSPKPWVKCRCLAELIFLAIIIPAQNTEKISSETFPSSGQQLITSLQTNSNTTVKQLIEDLRLREPVMQAIATALIDVIKTKSEKIISQVQQQSSQQFICVKRSIIEWSRLEGADQGTQGLLKAGSQPSKETVEWFKHIEICDTPETTGLLFSVQVNTELCEHNLVTKGDAYEIKAQKLLTKQLLQIVWLPCSFEKDASKKWKYNISNNAIHAKNWMLPAAVQIEYELQTFQRSKDKKDEKNKQYHAAAVSAFSVLVYCCLWRIIDRLKQDGNNDFTTLMLRLQEQGKEADEMSGDNYVYAAAQSLEAILAEDTNIKMQGVVLENLSKQTDNTQWIKRNVFNALVSAFPLAISTPKPPEVPKIGLISYATRPCNETVGLDSKDRGYLFLTQSYIATAISSPLLGYELKAERKQSDIVDSPEKLRKQRLVQEEIAYLKNQGCQHIILLSHAYGGRRFNRIADYNSILTPKEFLEDVFQTFPDLNIYTMLRDVFPATRLRERGIGEAGFEILEARDHTNFLHSVERVQVRDVIPVYTFATLYAVQENERPQSGFCVYFLVSDQRMSDITWTERPRQHLINANQNDPVHPCLISVLRGLHFIEAQGVVKKGQLIPVLDPFDWISPNTVETAGEVEVLHTRRKGKVYLSYPALLTHISQVVHRRK
ncbi:MAG TPA: hypothetical protein VK203_19820 [Nostocaceae cyanobacterium]|nr:hypothetical protein [Nostocaceae cyanobacterium]